jgi:tRNA A37 methylthiotransferase MiaB
MKVCFETFGCRLNRAEALNLEALFLANGWSETKKHSDADLIIIRGCSVTARAQHDTEKYIAQLSKPRVHKTKPEVVEFRAAVATHLANAEEPKTNKELATELEVSPQKMAAALRWLVQNGNVIRTEGEKKSDPATFVIA